MYNNQMSDLSTLSATPPCHLSSLSGLVQAQPLHSRWSTALMLGSEGLLSLDGLEFLRARVTHIEKNPYDAYKGRANDFFKDFNVVWWDEGKVSSVEEKPLISGGFGPCIAVLGRATKKGENLISYTALHHVFVKPNKVKHTLKTLIQKIRGSGTIELFISGGYADMSSDYLKDIKKVIQNTKAKNPNIKLVIKDNTFGIADSGNKSTRGGVKALGFFNATGNPYQIIND